MLDFPIDLFDFERFLVTNTYLSIFLASMLTVLKGLGWVSSFKNYGSRKHFNSTGSTVSVKSSLDDLGPLHNPNRCVYCFTASSTYLFFLPATKRFTVLLITVETADQILSLLTCVRDVILWRCQLAPNVFPHRRLRIGLHYQEQRHNKGMSYHLISIRLFEATENSSVSFCEIGSRCT